MDQLVDKPTNERTQPLIELRFSIKHRSVLKNFGRLYARDGNRKSAILSHLDVQAIFACVQPANRIKNITAGVWRLSLYIQFRLS